MNLQLFTNAAFRTTLEKFIPKYLNDDELFVDINKLLLVMYDENNNIKNTIEASILYSKVYVGFEHEANDAVLQRLIFYALVFSFYHYPTQDGWKSFLELPADEKMVKTREGISLIASTLLIKDLEKKLLIELKRFNSLKKGLEKKLLIEFVEFDVLPD